MERCHSHSNRGKCNDVIVIQKLLDQHIERARNQGTRENNHIAHCAHTSGSASVKAQNFRHVRVKQR